VIYCEDGYMFLDPTSEFLDPYTVFDNKANLTYNWKGPPRDVRLGSIISIVNAQGDSFIAVRKKDLKQH
jgi:hypothetical protein